MKPLKLELKKKKKQRQRYCSFLTCYLYYLLITCNSKSEVAWSLSSNFTLGPIQSFAYKAVSVHVKKKKNPVKTLVLGGI